MITPTWKIDSVPKFVWLHRLLHKTDRPKLVTVIRKANPYRKMAKATQDHRTCPNLLERQFDQGVPEKVLLTYITYLRYGTGHTTPFKRTNLILVTSAPTFPFRASKCSFMSRKSLHPPLLEADGVLQHYTSDNSHSGSLLQSDIDNELRVASYVCGGLG